MNLQLEKVVSYFLGLDLGQAQDYTALTVAEREQLEREVGFNRYAAAVVIGALALLFILFIALRRGRQAAVEPKPEPAPAKTGEDREVASDEELRETETRAERE